MEINVFGLEITSLTNMAIVGIALKRVCYQI